MENLNKMYGRLNIVVSDYYSQLIWFMAEHQLFIKMQQWVVQQLIGFNIFTIRNFTLDWY